MKQGAARSDYLDWLAQALAATEAFAPLPDGDAVVGYATGYDAADIAPIRDLAAGRVRRGRSPWWWTGTRTCAPFWPSMM